MAETDPTKVALVAQSVSSIQYKEVPGFPAYRVGSDGSVWSCWGHGGRRRILTDDWRLKATFTTNKGHLRVELRNGEGRIKKYNVHRLVLEAFVGGCPDGHEGCHNDGNPANNHLSNLRWDTPKANWEDRKRHGRGGEGIKSPQAKLDDWAVRVIRRARRQGVTLKVLAKRFNVSMAKVSQVARGQNWRHVNG